jgi:hypothetical protein
MGFAGWRAEIEIEGTLDGFAVLREIVGAQRGFEGGSGFFGWVGDWFAHALHL